MPDLDTAAVLRLAAAAEAVDGVAPLDEATELALRGDDPRDAHLTTYEHQQPTAYAHLRTEDDGTSWAELVVHPDHRRRRLGGQLLTGLRSREPAVRVWAHGDLPAAQALAKRAGMTAVRDLQVMRRPVASDPQIQPPVLPEGFSARAFRDTDAQDWLSVNAAAFAHHPEQGRMTMADLRERMAQPWWDPAGLLLIHDDATGALAASHWTKIADPTDGTGEVYVVAVSPAYQGRGLGRAVTMLGLDHLRSRGVTEIELYVEGDNTAALATYTRLGFAVSAHHRMYAWPLPAGDPGLQR